MKTGLRPSRLLHSSFPTDRRFLRYSFFFFFFFCTLVVLYVAFTLTLFIPHLSFFCWLKKAVLRDCCISWGSFLIFLSLVKLTFLSYMHYYKIFHQTYLQCACPNPICAVRHKRLRSCNQTTLLRIQKEQTSKTKRPTDRIWTAIEIPTWLDFRRSTAKPVWT